MKSSVQNAIKAANDWIIVPGSKLPLGQRKVLPKREPDKMMNNVGTGLAWEKI